MKTCCRTSVKDLSIPDTSPDGYSLLNKGKGFLPTRLIDVGTSQSGEKTCLVLAKNLCGDEKYVTLSHCWGSDESKAPLRLLEANKDRFLYEIPWAHLPLNFKDAVLATRQLGIRYLWIDSPCIIQNSISDWEQEAALMAEVYSNALCTLAASEARDPTEGFLSEVSKWNPCLIRPRNLPDSLQNAAFLHLYPEGNHRNLEQIIRRTPLNHRGWVFQERLLSKYTLHFTKLGLFLEGRQRGTEASSRESFFRRSFYGPISWKVYNQRSFTSHDGWPEWVDVIQTYSRCLLSEQSDKLIALSGCARSFRRAFSLGTYYAGFWENHLLEPVKALQALLWYCPRTSKVRPVNYRAPTWSWASVDDYVEIDRYYYRSPRNILARVSAVSTEVEQLNLFGNTRSGLLRLTAPLLAASSVDKFHHQFYRDTYSESDVGENDGIYFCFIGAETWQDRGLILQFRGLVLKAERGENGRYSRIGAFRFNGGVLEISQLLQESCIPQSRYFHKITHGLWELLSDTKTASGEFPVPFYEIEII